jgi:hypothetical protein
MVANQGARRMRACILGVIPGDVKEAAVKQCEETLRVKVNVTPEKIQNMLKAFAELGVSQEMIEGRIQRHVEAITPALLVQLTKIFNSLKDGMSAVQDWFQVEGVSSKAPEKGSLSVSDLKAGQVSQPPSDGTKTEAPPQGGKKAGADAAMAQAKENLRKRAEAEKAKAPAKPEPPENPNYGESEPDPFAPGGDLFGKREPGMEG